MSRADRMAGPRGVYTHRHKGPGGKTIMLAVDSSGERVAEVYMDEERRALIASALWNILEAVDPVGGDRPPLTVVDGEDAE